MSTPQRRTGRKAGRTSDDTPAATTRIPDRDRGRYVPPALPLPLLQRQRLLDRIAKAERHRLTLLHADAGYGKSTLLVQYADLLRAGSRRAAWLTLHRSDEDPVVLLTDLIGAIRREIPGFGARILATLQRSRRLERQLHRLAELVADELHGAGEIVVLVDDRWQLRGNAALAQFTNDLIELLPSTAHVVLAMRRTPQMPGLARWRLGGEVLDVSAAELAFTRDEAGDLLRREFALQLPDHAVDTIYSRTGGWPAGLRLAAAFVADRGWADLTEFRGSATQLYEYFNTEVLAKRSRRTTDLLLRWSLLDRVEEESASAIVGHEARAVIETLEQAGLMLRDAEAGGCRFQPLFSEFLRTRAREMLPASDIVEVHRRFADRALEAGHADQAVYHLQQAGDYKRAAALVRDRGEELLASSEVTTLQRWLDGFPPGVEQRLPWVLLMRGVLHRVRGDYERALSHYTDASEQFRRAKDVAGLARALVWSAQALRYLRRPAEALDTVREGLACLGDGASLQSAWALHVLGGCYQDLGEADAAANAYLRADSLFSLLGHTTGQLTEAHALGQLHHQLGNLEEAQRSYLRALNLQQTTGDVNILCWTQAGLVDLRVKRGDIAEAGDELRQIRELAHANTYRLAEAAACGTQITLHSMTGEIDLAEEAYLGGLRAVEGTGDVGFMLRLSCYAAETRALRGDLPGARDALRSAEAAVEMSPSPLVAARVAIARGTVLEAEGQTSAAHAAYRSGVDSAVSAAGRYLATKGALLAARLDTDRERSVEALRSNLVTLQKEGYRDFLILRPALAEWMRDTAARAGLPVIEVAGTRPADAPAVDRAVSATERIQVFLLGAFEVRVNGARVSDRAWRTSKAKELFALLVLDRQRPLGRDELIEQLWPESDLTAAVSNFHFTLHSLRKALSTAGDAEGSTVGRTDAGYQLALPAAIHFDVDLFQRSLRRAREARRGGRPEEAVQLLRGAVAIHRGEFLSDLNGPWIEKRREETTRLFVSAARELAELELEQGDPHGAIRPIERLLEREPYDESAHRMLIRAYHESGDTALAVRHYQALVSLLKRELGEDPQPETNELYLRLRAAVGRGGSGARRA